MINTNVYIGIEIVETRRYIVFNFICRKQEKNKKYYHRYNIYGIQ